MILAHHRPEIRQQSYQLIIKLIN